MKIGIDCRMYGLKHTGSGRYIKNLLGKLLAIDKENEYIIYSGKEEMKEIRVFLNNLSKKIHLPKIRFVLADIKHYSLKEQLVFPFLLYRKKLNLVHFPQFNLPVFYWGKYVVTVHDLIKHTSKGTQTTTRSPSVYWFKYLIYRAVFWLAVKRAVKILVPSRFVKSELIEQYNLDPERIIVSYEGVDSQIKASVNPEKIMQKYSIKKPFLLYVGNLYPHKNVERLIEAVKLLDINLVVVCGRSVFWERLEKKVGRMKAENWVKLVGFVPDKELAVLYRQAKAFVFPSLSEGFGLPGLEAMAQGIPVVASDIPVFREVYNQAAAYFNPFSPEEMAQTIKQVTQNTKQRRKLIKEGKKQAKKYSWEKMAKEALAVYNAATR